VYDPTGATLKRPPRCESTSAAQIDGLSNRGQHSQSIDPSVDTSAADRQSPITA
jgi:hypothetical protein